MSHLQPAFDEFFERMRIKKEAEDKEDAEKAEKLRQEYLKRTGRKELVP
jgi:hypothetical protein